MYKLNTVSNGLQLPLWYAAAICKAYEFKVTKSWAFNDFNLLSNSNNNTLAYI